MVNLSNYMNDYNIFEYISADLRMSVFEYIQSKITDHKWCKDVNLKNVIYCSNCNKHFKFDINSCKETVMDEALK